MYYLLSLFCGTTMLSVMLFSWSFFCGMSSFLEESEHFLFVLLSGMMILLILSVTESGMMKWSKVTIIIISGLFCMSSPLWVYIFFELSLLPVLVLIMGWGVQPERISAGYHLLIYTLIFSSPLLMGVLFMESKMVLGMFLWSFLMGLAFMVKTPMYLVHVWLPKAHVEAPTAGSIILAGILLKMGGVGLIWLQNFCSLPWNLFFFLCVLLGSSIAALISGFQSDGKALVAYSSVAHMNFGMLVVMLSAVVGDSSSSLLMFNHGLVSSGLFLLVGMSFHFLSSRLVYFFTSIFLLKSLSFLAISWVFACNFSVPPSLSFFGEVSALSLSLNTLWGSMIFFVVYFLFVAYYSLFLNLSLAGNSKVSLGSVSSVITWGVIGVSLADWCFWSAY